MELAMIKKLCRWTLLITYRRSIIGRHIPAFQERVSLVRFGLQSRLLPEVFVRSGMCQNLP
jgi:hypothetical protein